MSWFNVWDGLKNKTCRYLLQRYLGQFLDEQLNLEQLKIELFDGKATVNHVLLRVEVRKSLCVFCRNVKISWDKQRTLFCTLD